MKKVLSTLIVSSIILSSSAFANQSLSQIMANHREELQDKGVQVATTHTVEAIVENNISSSELKNFLQLELSPRDFAKFSASLEAGISKDEIGNLVLDIGNGANFKKTSCYSAVNQVLLWGGSIAAITYASYYMKDSHDADKKRRDNIDYVNSEERLILELENQITALKNQGVSGGSYLITTRKADIKNAELAIYQSKVTSAADADKLDNNAKNEMIIAGVGAAAAGITALTCKF